MIYYGIFKYIFIEYIEIYFLYLFNLYTYLLLSSLSKEEFSEDSEMRFFLAFAFSFAFCAARLFRDLLGGGLRFSISSDSESELSEFHELCELGD